MVDELIMGSSVSSDSQSGEKSKKVSNNTPMLLDHIVSNTLEEK